MNSLTCTFVGSGISAGDKILLEGVQKSKRRSETESEIPGSVESN